MSKKISILLFLFLFSLLQADQSELKIKTRFVTVDLMVDSENAKVAAWQCELHYDKEKVSIVGIEGNRDALNWPIFSWMKTNSAKANSGLHVCI